MHESIVLDLRLPDGRKVLQRRDDDAPSSRGMLAFFGGGVEDTDLCRHHGAVREKTEEIEADFAIEYMGYFLYLSQKLEPPIACISIYAGEVDKVPGVNEGSAEIIEPRELSGYQDLASSTVAVLAKLDAGLCH